VDGRAETREQVEAYIVGLLAKDLEQDEAELRAELTDVGPEMPYDSVLLVELMTRVEKQFGVRLNPSLQTARDMRSVRSFAERVCDELDAVHSRPNASAPDSTEGSDDDER
jgi:acyl carrier protein